MDREIALDALPLAYAKALRLHAAGRGDLAIAQALDIEPEGVPTLLKVAAAKLASIWQEAEAHVTSD